MALELELVGPNDKPALLAVSDQDLISAMRTALEELAYKVHVAKDHANFLSRFAQIPYQIVVVEDRFDAPSYEENKTIQTLQTMPMLQRRHAVSILLTDLFPSLHAMHA